MATERSTTPPPPPDASDVVAGPVGDASLRDPATSGPIGADLEALTPIDIPTDKPPDGPPAEADPGVP